MKTASLTEILENIDNFIPAGVRVIGMAGGSGSGKSYIARRISKRIGARILSVDDYIIPSKITKDGNWDLPECWDLSLLDMNLTDFLNGKSFRKPIYGFKNIAIDRYETFESGGSIIIEGLYSLHDPITDYINLSIFVKSPEDIRLARVMNRDLVERGEHSKTEITRRWNEMIQPAFLRYIEPQRNNVDLIISN